MVLKFFAQRKHLTRLVFGFTAASKVLLKGQRERKQPSVTRQGIRQRLFDQHLNGNIIAQGIKLLAGDKTNLDH